MRVSTVLTLLDKVIPNLDDKMFWASIFEAEKEYEKQQKTKSNKNANKSNRSKSKYISEADIYREEMDRAELECCSRGQLV
jgi:hypothetical protein